jgi:hypothetical protein
MSIIKKKKLLKYTNKLIYKNDNNNNVYVY